MTLKERIFALPVNEALDDDDLAVRLAVARRQVDHTSPGSRMKFAERDSQLWEDTPGGD